MATSNKKCFCDFGENFECCLPNKTVDIYDNPSEEIFRDIICHKREPAVLKNVEFGSCLTKWTPNFLEQQLGDEEVTIHVGSNPELDFLQKNFLYRKLKFGEFLQRASENQHKDFFINENEIYYLRSLGGNPRKDIANINQQFPQLAADFRLPEILAHNDVFSTVFRVSSANVQIWTHYDVMENILTQIHGSKRVVLFSPEDALNLYLVGDKSEVIDIDHPDLRRWPRFNKATRYECVLKPGDSLYIPALWFHNVRSLEFSIGLNAFWHDSTISKGHYDQKDIYGNKDFLPAQKALQLADKALKSLSELPDYYKDFYVRRIISDLNRTLPPTEYAE